MTDAATALRDILNTVDRPLTDADAHAITGNERVLPTNFRISTAASAALTAVGLAAADIWELRTGRRQKVTVDTRPATLVMRSERYLQIDGAPTEDPWARISGVYETKDGRWIQLHCNFPHHAAGTIRVLGVPEDKTAVAEAVATWDGLDLENALAEAGMCARMLRSPEEWAATEQAKALAALPLMEIARIGDSKPEPLPEDGAKPLSGVRGLDLTRVLAGPVSGKLLAGFGADIMRVA